ncbi:hypothetical protein [Kribbella sp. NPDC006257]|uniref:hypothetical protein n=1 Tax=Kribbella sp. NPDC006257 TaxID=3156738 RepID=UPI0033A4FD6C
MEIIRLNLVPSGPVSRFGSEGFSVAGVGRIQAGHLACLRLAADGRIGRHPAVGRQLLLLVSGDATVSGDDGAPVELMPGEVAVWAPGESHETTSDAGMTAFVVEGEVELSPGVS